MIMMNVEFKLYIENAFDVVMKLFIFNRLIYNLFMS
jgi:hypothetical protein